MTTYGPMELVVVGFPDADFHGGIAPAIGRAIDQGSIRVADLIFIEVDDNGDALGLELSDLPDHVRGPFADLALDGTTLLSEEDVEDVAAMLEPGSAVAVMLFEHVWARELVGALAEANGEVLSVQRIPAEAVEQVLAERAGS
ncbi:MAG: hypothetical protein JJU45_17550 [Acidimicrobiia bacterium]|nr:hypothetical protein [Acidimicrobiia bacterium]